MRKLIVSFTGALYAMSCNGLTTDDLSTALFAMGCTIAHVFEPGAGGEYVEQIVRDNPEIYAAFRFWVQRATVEGRVVWRTREEPMSYKKINALLVANGYDEISIDSPRPGWNESYCYPGVLDRVQAAWPLREQIEVIGA